MSHAEDKRQDINLKEMLHKTLLPENDNAYYRIINVIYWSLKYVLCTFGRIKSYFDLFLAHIIRESKGGCIRSDKLLTPDKVELTAL